MKITFLTVFWSIMAILSIVGIYWFNNKRTILSFITSRKYLMLFIVASLFGMRQNNWMALILLGVAFYLMSVDYKPYIETCKRLKRIQEQK